jgi:hypothetical protein
VVVAGEDALGEAAAGADATGPEATGDDAAGAGIPAVTPVPGTDFLISALTARLLPAKLLKPHSIATLHSPASTTNVSRAHIRTRLIVAAVFGATAFDSCLLKHNIAFASNFTCPTLPPPFVIMLSPTNPQLRARQLANQLTQF